MQAGSTHVSEGLFFALFTCITAGVRGCVHYCLLCVVLDPMICPVGILGSLSARVFLYDIMGQELFAANNDNDVVNNSPMVLHTNEVQEATTRALQVLSQFPRNNVNF